MIGRDSVKRNGLRFLYLYFTTLLDGREELRLYKVLNAGVPIILAHVVLLKIIIS